MPFIAEDFLLETKTARHLYHQYAADEPILDYHCHLPASEIAENRRFSNLTEIWLEGDHYKWRAMRANGVPERFCTGDADPYEKFLAWARTAPYTLRNPLYHWTHLELKRYFGIDELLDETSAPRIWRETSEQLHTDDLSAQGILQRFRVAAVCTSDDPADDLKYHQAIAISSLPTRVYPTFRPDNATHTQDPVAFNSWVDRLAARADIDIGNLDEFLHAISQRHAEFHKLGCRLSDHGLNHCYEEYATDAQARVLFDKLRSGQGISHCESEQFAGFMMLSFGHLDAEKGWTKQLHLGALRNASPKMLHKYGPNTGFDSIGDWPQARGLAAYLGRLESENALPKIILYNVNPADNYVVATMIGNFQDGSVPGKIQFGSGWWFLDQKKAMEWQLNALSNTGLLSRFVGMTTDSRSFMSYPRHEYFRRVLCNLIGNDVERGLIPNDQELLGSLVKNLSFGNAVEYFGLELGIGDDRVQQQNTGAS
jgi:glucuronate isomerase